MCPNCMKYRPPYSEAISERKFICPECKQVWLMAPEGPGSYWETKEDQEEQKKKFEEFLKKYKKNNLKGETK